MLIIEQNKGMYVNITASSTRQLVLFLVLRNTDDLVWEYMHFQDTVIGFTTLCSSEAQGAEIRKFKVYIN